MAPITNDSTQVSTGYLGYKVPVSDAQTSNDTLMNKLRATVTPKPKTMKTGYMVPADTTKANLPTSLNQDEVTKWFGNLVEEHKKVTANPASQSQPVTTHYPNGQYKKVNGEWKRVVSETFIPATTPEEKQDLMNKWLNGIK